MKKKFLSLLLSAAMMFSLLQGTVYAAELPNTAAITETTQTTDPDALGSSGAQNEVSLLSAEVPVANEDGYYPISSTEDLVWFRDQVNSGNTAYKAKLMTDIDISSITDWTPIGATNAYTGTFDGNGHTVSGMTMSVYASGSAINKGFFGILKGATVSNLKVAGDITITGGGQNNNSCVGGIVGMIDGTSPSTIQQCESAVNIKSDTPVVVADFIGGIAGTARIAKITDCVYSGTINLKLNYNVYIRVGGIVGYGGGALTTNNTLEISQCANYGTLSLVENSNRSEPLGGILGYVNVRDVGHAVYIKNCYNGGKIGPGTNIKIGAIAADLRNSTAANTHITDCYYLEGTATAPGNGTDGSVSSVTAAEAKSGEAARKLNGGKATGAWGQTNPGADDSKPALSNVVNGVQNNAVYKIDLKKADATTETKYTNGILDLGTEKWQLANGQIVSGKYYFTSDSSLTQLTNTHRVYSGAYILTTEGDNTTYTQGGGLISGGGEFVENSTPTLKLESTQVGYKFDGWFSAESLDSDLTVSGVSSSAVSTAADYTLSALTADAVYIAVFEAVETKFDLNVNGSNFTVNESALQTDGHNQQYNANTQITLTANNDNNDFIGWYNETNRLLSKDTTYTFTLTAATTINLKRELKAADTEQKARVVYESEDGRIITSVEYTSGQTITVPAAPLKLGYTFDKWSLSTEEINSKINSYEHNIIVTPVYKVNTNLTSTVSVTGGKVTMVMRGNEAVTGNTYYLRDQVTVKAVVPQTGLKFSHWENEDHMVLSKQEEYSFYLTAAGQTKLNAVFVPEDVQEDSDPVFAVTSGTQSNYVDSGNNNVSQVTYTYTYEMPSDCELMELGVLYTYADQTPNLTLENTTVKKLISGLSGKTGTYIVNILAANSQTRYVRGYMTYKKNGNLYTIYTELKNFTATQSSN